MPSKITSNYKTELCKNYSETTKCKYGKKCQFAHGEEELRSKEKLSIKGLSSKQTKILRSMPNAAKYKTEVCSEFQKGGSGPAGCQYGKKCKFAHGIEELRSEEQNTNSLLVSVAKTNTDAESRSTKSMTHYSEGSSIDVPGYTFKDYYHAGFSRVDLLESLGYTPTAIIYKLATY